MPVRIVKAATVIGAIDSRLTLVATPKEMLSAGLAGYVKDALTSGETKLLLQGSFQ